METLHPPANDVEARDHEESSASSRRMSKERRYQEDEVRQILDLAIGPEGAPAQSLPAVEGLTLLQLQEVGREVGLPPESYHAGSRGI